MHAPRPVLCAVAAALVVAVVAGGCSSSGFRYVKVAGTKAYLKVPQTWTRIGQDQLTQAEVMAKADSGSAPAAVDQQVERAIESRVAFDADPRPSALHVIGLSSEPVVDVRVRTLSDSERDQLNLAALRNLVFQYDQLKQQASQPGATDNFRPLREQELELGSGLRGMRLTFEVRAQDGYFYAIDQTALVDGTTSRIYLLVIQAGETQYLANRKLLDGIAASFTVRQKG